MIEILQDIVYNIGVYDYILFLYCEIRNKERQELWKKIQASQAE